jgi:hypothetical protein
MSSNASKQIRAALAQMVSLDSGMVNGRAISATERDATYDRLLADTDATFIAFAQAHPRRAAELARGIPVYDRPKRLDLGRWIEFATKVKQPPGERIALAEVPDELGEQLLGLDRFSAAHPGQLVMEPPAGREELEEAETHLGVTLTLELRALYRWCNGFSWRYTADSDGEPLRFLPIHTVQRACDLVDEPPRRGRLKTLPKATTKILEHPNRLTIFDLLDGSFVSLLCADDGTQALIDDDREGATTISREPLARFIAHLLDPGRVEADGRWYPGIAEYFSSHERARG